MKEFGPNSFERLAQGSQDRESLIGKAKDLLQSARLESSPQDLDPDRLREKTRSFFDRLPKGPKLLLHFGLPNAALAIVLAACGETVWEEAQRQAEERGQIAGANVERVLDVEPFLRYPVPRDEDVRVVQGWVYKGFNDGQIHGAIDYIDGADLDRAETWSERLTVMAAAPGRACQYSFGTTQYGRDFAVKIRHANGFETRYLHMKRDSIKYRGLPLPSCGEKEEVWFEVIAGEALGLAGDSGTEPGWFHLHFQVLDPQRRSVDPYGLRGQRDLYPNTDNSNSRYCGENALFFEEICPRALVLGVNVTVEPKAIPTKDDITARQEMIDRKFQEAEDMAGQFVELLLSGTPSDLQQAFAIQIPYELRHQFESYSTSVSGGRGSLYDIQVCAAQMRLGEFQRYSTNKYQKRAKVDLSETDKLNIERGLYPRERYAIAVDFTFRPYDTGYGRLAFRDYQALHADTYLVFEDVDGRLYLASNRLCFKSPVGIKVAQDPFRD